MIKYNKNKSDLELSGKGGSKNMLKNRTLFFGDNLDILREKFPDKPDADGYFDLIYLDPPFNSNRDFGIIKLL